MSNSRDNPFYYNYVFSKEDLNRCRPSFWSRLDFLFCPTYVQISDGFIVLYKKKNNQYLITKFEKLPEIKL